MRQEQKEQETQTIMIQNYNDSHHCSETLSRLFTQYTNWIWLVFLRGPWRAQLMGGANLEEGSFWCRGENAVKRNNIWVAIFLEADIKDPFTNKAPLLIRPALGKHINFSKY